MCDSACDSVCVGGWVCVPNYISIAKHLIESLQDNYEVCYEWPNEFESKLPFNIY